MSIQTRSELVALLERHGLSARKALGQHFLADPNLIRKMVATAGIDESTNVLEIGVGTATLTGALADTGAKVLGFEIDRGLEPIHLEVLAGFGNVEIAYEDAMKVDLVSRLGDRSWVLVANLPYNVGTMIILDALRHLPQVVRMVVMVQREVAERLTASVGSKVYGIPSVIVQMHGEAHLAFKVPPQVFVPPPRVESAVVVIHRRHAPDHSEAAIELAAAAFGHRRKMLRGALPEVTPRQWAEAGIDPTDRAEQLMAADFNRLAGVLDA